MIFFLVGIVFWSVFFGLVAMTIAEERGDAGLEGFFVGAIFGPIGVVIAYWLGDQEAKDIADVESGRRKVCPDCAELVRPQARVCRYCSHAFGPPPLELTRVLKNK
ncbi:MAG: hypothetical protein KDE63_01235 [Novosphingobium sp.]|nr:hypothetical protein [Novosphingobium sp.]